MENSLKFYKICKIMQTHCILIGIFGFSENCFTKVCSFHSIDFEVFLKNSWEMPVFFVFYNVEYLKWFA